MEYNLKAAKHHIAADVEIQDNGNLRVKVDQNLYDVRYHMVSDHLIHMAVNMGDKEKLVNAYVSVCPEGKNILIHGRHYLVSDLEQEGKKTKRGMSPDLPDQITPPMPAVVVRISVQVGNIVKKGQGVIVVSAMKMETTLCAPFDGTVIKINCAINDKVSPGQILAEIKNEGVNENE